MNEVSVIQKTEQILKSIHQLGFYKLMFSQKAAFCFVLLFVSTAIVAFSAWAVYRHIIDSSTFGTIVITFGGITATIASVYNIVHGINDRAAMQANSIPTTQPPTTDTNLPNKGIL